MKKKYSRSTNGSIKILISTLVLIGISFFLLTHVVFAQEEEQSERKPIWQQVLEEIFGNAKPRSETDQDDDTNKPLCRPKGYTGSGDIEDPQFDGDVDTSINYAALSLNQPKKSLTDLYYNRLMANANGIWAAKQLLYYEKVLKSKGHRLYPYYVTGWLWFENGGKQWPDPYLHNCNDKNWNASIYCTGGLLQVGGYQAQDRRSNYKEVYAKCHGSTPPSAVMRKVIENSFRARHVDKFFWSYQRLAGQGMVGKYNIDKVSSIDMIDPSKLYTSEEQQYYYVLLGKDPCMVVGLNAYAVNSLPGDIKSKAWAKYVREQLDVLTNMVSALEKFDKGSSAAGSGSMPKPDIRTSPGVSSSPRPTANSSVTPASSSADLPPDDPYYGLPECDENGNPPPTWGGNNGGGGSWDDQGGSNQLSIGKYTHYCQCDPKWTYNAYGWNAACNAGCGPTTLCAILETLGVGCKNPRDMIIYAQNQSWWKNLFYYEAFFKSGFLESKGLKKTVVFQDSHKGGRSLTHAEAKQYFEGANKNKCLIFASSDTLNHIFYIRGVTSDGNILVVDSWKGCGTRNGVPPANNNFDVQPPSYANYYAYAICKK